MSQRDNHTVKVQLLDKAYSISCPDGAEAELLASADYLNQKMKEIRRHGKIIGLERIAVMAALNIAHELLQVRESGRSEVEARLRQLGAKIDRSIQQRSPPDNDASE